MQDDPPAGNLEDSNVAAIVGGLIQGERTGVLEIEEHQGISKAFFLNGMPQGARLGHVENRLGEVLLGLGLIDDTVLAEALEFHRRTGKLLGQIFVEMGVVDSTRLEDCIKRQSRMNFASLFALKRGAYKFYEGMVHLSGFTPAPASPLGAVYEGVRDHLPEEVLVPFLARLAFAAVKSAPEVKPWIEALEPAEKMTVELLSDFRLPGDLARRIPLPVRSLGALLYALHCVGMLEEGPAIMVIDAVTR